MQPATKPDSTELPFNENSVRNFRLQFNLYFGITNLVLLGPYALNHLIAGRSAMALLSSAVVVIALINSVSIFRRKIQVIPFQVFYTIVLITLASGLVLQGPLIIYWFYPFALIVLSSVEHRQARIMLIISMAILIPIAFLNIELAIATRFAVTYFMVCLLGDLVVELLERVQIQQAKLVITDPLTGALNRRSMLTHLDDAIEGCERGFGTASLLMIDIDHFKSINDTAGHKAGDDALKAVVAALVYRKRKLDELFRTGGEEFVVLARNLESGGAIAFADSLRSAVEQSNILEGKRVTISIGVANYEAKESVDDWLKRADANMYEAKRRGRNCVWPPYSDLKAS